MTTTISVTSNIDDVIADVDNVKDDIIKEMKRRVGRAVSMLERRARSYVRKDAHYTGSLHRSINTRERLGGEDHLVFNVHTDPERAPYAAIVEFGSGSTYEEFSESAYGGAPSTFETPPSYPFETPDIAYNKDDPYDTTGYGSFAGFVGHLEEWMKKKGITPKSGDYFTSAVGVAVQIIEQGSLAHPFMRPAWFDSELKIRKAARNALKNAVR